MIFPLDWEEPTKPRTADTSTNPSFISKKVGGGGCFQETTGLVILPANSAFYS